MDVKVAVVEPHTRTGERSTGVFIVYNFVSVVFSCLLAVEQ